MDYIHKTGFKIINNKLEKAYNIEVKQTNKGYNITGYNNDKIIKKSVRYRRTKNTNTKKGKPKKNKKKKKKTKKGKK
jgi:hypothetical protein